MPNPSRHSWTRALSAALLPVLVGAASAHGQSSEAAPNSVTPKLVVFIAVDQLTPVYFDRYGSQFTGGFARLLKGGAVFTNAFQDHANTETAPGHASMMSGRFPRSTGIVLNNLGVPDPQSPLVGEGGPAASPFRFRGGTLIDWLRMKDPDSRALSVSRKDRGAILPLGRAHQSVFWYAPDGRFTTSRYYADTLPAWVTQFNARHIAQKSAGKSWTLVGNESDYTELDASAVENNGTDNVFPHVMSADSAQAARDFIQFPWMDQATADIALAGVNAMQLGAGASTDILSVSFSTTDAIGHRYGMESREIHDQVLRLDRTLGAFIDSLYRLRDSSRIVFALTADHGVAPTPELWMIQKHQPTYRVSLDAQGTQYRVAAEQRGVATGSMSFDSGILFVDRTAFARAHVNADSMIDAFAREAMQRSGVLRVDRPRALAHADTIHDAIARRWLHALPLDSYAALVVTLKPHSVWGSYATGIHGGPSDDDAHVPIIFYGPRIRAGRYGEFVRSVDMAPTLAYLMKVTPAERLDGHVLVSAITR